MLIEIRKAGFINRGALLMLLAVRQQLASRYSSAQLAMAPSRTGASQPLPLIRQYGMLAKCSFWRAGVQWGDIASVLPYRLRNHLRLSLDKEIDVVVDAAGFAYGTPWPERNLTELGEASKRWHSRGTPLILLPQAFGTFDTPTARNQIKQIASAAKLIFARDQQSLSHLKAILADHPGLRLAPDFTCLLPGILTANHRQLLANHENRAVAIVPNARMIDRTGSKTGGAYLSFLSNCIGLLQSYGLEALLVIHGGREDFALAERLTRSNPRCAIVDESDPQQLKGLLGNCRASIGSRYHGLINCLCQATPAFGTSWSHKYGQLFEDYRFEEGLVHDLSIASARHIVACLSNDSWIKSVRERLLVAADSQKKASENMWREVFDVIDSLPASRLQ